MKAKASSVEISLQYSVFLSDSWQESQSKSNDCSGLITTDLKVEVNKGYQNERK